MLQLATPCVPLMRCARAPHRRTTQGFRQCLKDGRGQWLCGPGQSLASDDRKVLAALWDSTSHAQRDFVVHARVIRMANSLTGKDGTLWISGEVVPTRFPEARTTLAACHVVPLRASDELLRMLGPSDASRQP